MIYYLGMIFASMGCLHLKNYKRQVILILSAAGWIIWWLGMGWGKLPFDLWLQPVWGDGFNPPSVNTIVFTSITLFFCYTLFSRLEESCNRGMQKSMDVLLYIGKNTLYIFMYHILVRNYILNIFTDYGWNLNNVGIKIVVFVSMIALPILIKDIVLKGIGLFLRNIKMTVEEGEKFGG